MTITRRGFIGATGAAAAVGVGATFFERLAWALENETSPPPAGGRALIVIQMAGGNDGLNTVIPFADPSYRKLRPNLALGDAEMLKLDERLALHSALAPLRERFSAGTLAVVTGVGYPKPDRSHFVSTAIWQTAQLEPYRSPTGWLGRAVDFEPDPRKPRRRQPLEAIGIGGGGLSPSLYASGTPIPSLLSLEAFSFQPDRRYPSDAPALHAAMDRIYDDTAVESSLGGFVCEVGATAIKSSAALRTAAAAYSSMVTYPKNGLADQLKLIAQLLTANLGTRVFHLTLGGFDTHANQRPQQRNLLAQLAEGITAFLDDLKGHGLDDRVAVMTYSEFGRRAEENGSAGTDHGAASALFLAGTKVAGGIYGPVPDLSRLEGGDVPFGIDFRSVYASVLRDWLVIGPDKILGPGFGDLQLFRA